MFLAQVDINTWGEKKKFKKNPIKIPKQISQKTTLQNTRKIPTLKPQTLG